MNDDKNPAEEQVTLKKSEYEDIVNTAAKDKADKANLVAEIQELRDKKQRIEQEKAALEAKVTSPAPTSTPAAVSLEEVNKAIEAKLSSIERQEVEKQKELALQRFKATHKEFSDANDAGGLKFAAFERQFSRFNTNGLRTEQDFLGAFEDAVVLLNKGQAPTPPQQQNPNAFSNPGGSTPPVIDEDKNLTSQENKLIQTTFGGNKEKYLEQKAKRPDYVAKLLSYVN